MADKVYSSLVDTLNKTFKDPGLVDYFSNKLGIDTQASQKMVNPDTSINESNYNKVMNAITGNIPSETKMQFPEYAPYYGGEPVSSMGGRGITKAPNLTDRQKYAKALGISEDTLNALDANTTDLSKGIDALTQDKNLSAFMDKPKAQASAKAMTPSTPAGTSVTTKATPATQPTTAETAKTAPTATDTTQATPAPQGDDFQGRMAATAFGNVLASLGAGMAGYSPTSVNQMFQGLYGQLNQRQREKEERDPNSTVSKNYREMIAPYLPKGLNISDKSAFDLKQTLPFMMSRLEREEQRAFQASENAKDRAIKKEIYQSMIGQRNTKRSDDAFKILKNDAEKVYDASSARGILSDVNNAISVIEKAEKEGKSLTMSRVKGSLGIFGDPFGMRDPDLNMLGTLKNSVITKLNKLSGDNVISNNDRQMYIEDFPAINSGALKQHLVNLRNSIYEQRKLQKDKLNLYTNAVNEQYGTNFNSEDLFNLDIGENQNKAQEDKPKFRR